MAKSVSQLIKEATEAVKDVPDDLRPIAFQKAFDALAGAESGIELPKVPSASKRPGSAGDSTRRQSAKANDKSSRSHLDQLDRTSQPKISQRSTALENALRVLQAAHDELGIDGLSASDIAHVLNDKFRCRITRQAVSQALNRANKLVNRHKEGSSVVFKIMSGGEEYLADIDSGAVADPVKVAKKKSKPSKGAKASKGSTASTLSSDEMPNTKKAKKGSAKGKEAKKSRSRPGPKAALQTLIDSGYFSKPRSIGDTIEHLRHSTGHAYKQTDLSPALVRLLRERALARNLNSDNQYEYKNA